MLKKSVLPIICLFMLTVYVFGYAQWFNRGSGLSDEKGQPLGGDYIVYYAASTLALQGEPAAVYDTPRLTGRELEIAGPQAHFGLTAWYYPPLFLLLVWPFALAPYLVTLFAWLGLSLAGYLLVLRRLSPGPLIWLLGLSFGGTFLNFLSGQNGFLSAGLLGAGLLLLDENPRLSGIFFGLLCYKPQLAFLIPLALICGRRWQALLSLALTAALLALVSLAAFGVETWHAFFASLSAFSETLRQGKVVLKFKLLSPLAAAVLAGSSPGAARIIQACAGLIAALCLGYSFAKNFPLWLRGSVLCLAALLASPHTYGYDLAILALPLAWLYEQGRQKGFLAFEPLLLGLGWLAVPIGAPFLAEACGIQVTPLYVLVLMGLCLRRAKLETSAMETA